MYDLGFAVIVRSPYVRVILGLLCKYPGPDKLVSLCAIEQLGAWRDCAPKNGLTVKV